MRFLLLAPAFLSVAFACGGDGGTPEQPLSRFVDAINDADFNDAYEELSARCQRDVSLDEFQESYGQFFIGIGIGSGGFAGGTELRVEDVSLERAGDYEAEATLDWVLHASLDNPLPLLGTIAEQDVPLNTVLDVAGTKDDPLYILDESGEGGWRLDECDPLGLAKYYDDVGF